MESVSFLALWPGWLPQRVLFDWYKSTVPQVLPVCHSPVNTSPFEVISGAQLMANERERERERGTGDRLRGGGGGGGSSLYSLFSKVKKEENEKKKRGKVLRVRFVSDESLHMC